MKIIVFSDSHGAYSKMESALSLHSDADMVIFLGDGLRDADRLFEKFPNVPHAAVRGNCDFAFSFGGESYLDEQTVDLSDIRIFICHGHKYGVKSSPLSLWLRAKEKDAPLALFGHTHNPEEIVHEGVRLFNPGSIGLGSYGILYIEKGAVLASHGKV